MHSINTIELDTVTGGRSQAQKVKDAGTEALFCGSLDARANRPSPGPSWYAARKDLASTCWENLRDVVTPSRR
jgi:hypothetical protein